MQPHERIGDAIRRANASGKTALVPFITAGYPKAGTFIETLRAIAAVGDVVEIGVPFSDPMADGPVIQRASERALRHNITLEQVLGMVREFRTSDPQTPVILMGYLNPIEVMGYERFARAAASAGVDGVLTVDMPPEESGELNQALRTHGLDGIYLLAPTSSDDRIRRIAESASGFIYYVSLRGVTGAANLDLAEVSGKLRAIRAHTTLPVGVGFGIGTPEAAAAVAAFADAVIVGSAIVRRIEESAGQPDKILEEIPGFLARLREAMDRVAVRPEPATGASR